MKKGIFSAALALLLLGCSAQAALASMSWSPPSHDFGSQDSGISSAPVTFTLTAVCDTEDPMTPGQCSTLLQIYGTVTAPGVDFNIDSNNCNLASFPTTFYPGTPVSCTVRVAFKPSSPGPKTGVLQTSDPAAPDVTLSGNGVDPNAGVLTDAERKQCKKKKTKKKRKKCRRKQRRD